MDAGLYPHLILLYTPLQQNGWVPVIREDSSRSWGKGFTIWASLTEGSGFLLSFKLQGIQVYTAKHHTGW